MPPKQNPLKLNPLQLKSLVLFQELAKIPEITRANPDTGEVFIAQIPHPHGNHFHIGPRVVASKDATGLANPAVWVALERKGLMRGQFPDALILTVAGLAYETGIASQIMHGSDH